MHRYLFQISFWQENFYMRAFLLIIIHDQHHFLSKSTFPIENDLYNGLKIPFNRRND